MTIIYCGAAMTTAAYGFERGSATLKNKDSQSYAYIIKTACERDIVHDELHEGNGVIYDCGIYCGKIDSHSQAAICNFGCELTLAKTGQTITVEPGDTIVIKKGVLKVR
jgi:hypothetical protein